MSNTKKRTTISKNNEKIKENIPIKKKTTKASSSKSSKGKSKNLSKNKKENSNNLNDTIQSITSILFTVIIFVALLLIIFVIYNNYLKPKDNLDEVCHDYIEKDYGISDQMINNYIINSRVMLYNVESYDKNEVDNQKLTEMATFFIWGSTDKLEMCDDNEEYCLTTKITMPYQKLLTYFKNYLNIKNFDLTIEQEYLDTDTIRLYKENDNIILTFGEFEFESLRHNLVYKNIKEDKVTLIFALEKKVNDKYQYVGSKEVNLKLIDKNLSLENIKTTYRENN